METDEGTAKMQESQVNVITALITDSQPPVAIKPGESALNHPSVSAQPLATLHSFTCYATPDPSLTKRRSTPAVVIRFVSVPLVRALARAARLTTWAFDRLNAVHHLFQDHRVVGVSTRQFHRQRDAPSLDHNMALRARFALICGVRPNRSGLWVPLFTPLARMVSLSKLALDQSILSASPKRLSRTRCSLRHTPAFCQSRSLRQQVTPLPQPISWGSISWGSISWGSISQGRPLLSTKIMPVSAARSATRGRPPFGLGGSVGRSGSIISHSSSVTSGLLIVPSSTASHGPGFERRT
jgi:hypothetical protein